MILLLSMLMTLLSAEVVTPYGARDLALELGGRSFIDGYDAIRINPAGTGLLKEGEGQFGFGMDFGTYSSLSVGYVGDNGFHLIFASKDIDRKFTVGSMETYAGFSTELSKWWVIGVNLGYNYLKVVNGWDMNFGIDFGPGLPTAQKTGLIGSVTIRNPFENGGDGEVSAGLGYSYRSRLNINVDNIVIFRNKSDTGVAIAPQKRYDLVFAVESMPSEEDNFSMDVSARISGLARDNHVQAGVGVGYVSEGFRFNVGLFFMDFTTSFFKNTQFGFSLVSGV
ncbi:MAG: hypothetical protein WCQ53_09190 [bacterium]